MTDQQGEPEAEHDSTVLPGFDPELAHRIRAEAKGQFDFRAEPQGPNTAIGKAGPNSPIRWGLYVVLAAALCAFAVWEVPRMGTMSVVFAMLTGVLAVFAAGMAIVRIPGWVRARRIAKAWRAERGGAMPRALRWWA